MLKKIKSLKDKFSIYAETVEEISIYRLFFMFIIDFIKYKCTIRDFFIYKFYFLNSKGKKLFYTGPKQLKFYKKINDAQSASIMNSKEESFVKYRKYMQRDFCGTKYYCTVKDYENFIEKHNRFILKPISDFGGNGIKIVDLKKDKLSAEKLRKQCFEENKIIEEIIVQHKKMEQLHPASINSLRIMSCGKKVLGAVVRIGIGGNVVDNACAGGMFAQVEVETGIIVTKAVTYSGKEFYKHPDTGIMLLGFEIPLWDKCIELVKEAAEILPNIPITGFDIAITPDGPVLVEVNDEPGFHLLQQMQTIQMRTKLLKNIKIKDVSL